MFRKLLLAALCGAWLFQTASCVSDLGLQAQTVVDLATCAASAS